MRRRYSSVGNIVKRYAIFKAIRGSEKATKGAVGAIGSIVKLLFLLCGLLVLGYCTIIALPFVLVVIAIIAGIVFFIKKRKCKSQTADIIPESDLKRQAILREIDIMKDCEKMVNESADVAVVAKRYKLLIDKLDLLSQYSSSELSECGISIPHSFCQYKKKIEANKLLIFNQAIERSFKKEKQRISCLKTEAGKASALVHFFNNTSNTIRENGMPDECLSHLENICREK